MNDPCSGVLRTALGAAALAAALWLPAMTVDAQPPAFAEVLRRAQAYVVVYEDHQLSTVLAAEYYEQQVLGRNGSVKERRLLRSDYLLFQLPPEEDWFALRDVYEMDGQPVGDRSARLEALFDPPIADVNARAMAIARESARFNLGNVYRTINVPTFPLRFLRPANRSRFAFEESGTDTIEGAPTRVISYRETKKPAFVVTPDARDVLARGRFWVAPETGTVIRSEMTVGGTRTIPERATTIVTYRHDPTLDFWVPAQMEERYDSRRRRSEVITGRATYSAFRRFDSRTLRTVRPRP